MEQTPTWGLLAGLVLLLGVARVEAHGLGAEARLKDGCVHVEGYFDDDTAPAGARVWVEDNGKKFAEGRLDDRGRWSFTAPPPGRYHVIIDAGGGHRAKVLVKVPGAAEEKPEVVSQGKSREQFTRFPWMRLAVGLTVLGLLAFVVPKLLRSTRRPN